MLYTQDDFQSGRRQQLRAILILAALLTLTVLAGLIPMLAGRHMVLSIVLSSILGVVTLFVHGLYLSPVFAYARYLRGAQENIQRTFTGAFVREGDVSLREGVRCQAMYFADGEMEEPFLCYFDLNLPKPDLAAGVVYRITYTGNSILGLERIDA